VKKIITLIIIGMASFFVFGQIKPTTVTNRVDPVTISPKPTPSVIPQNTKYKILDTKYSLFMPYWTLGPIGSDITIPNIANSDTQTIDSLIYFGIAPTSDGSIQTTDTGYDRVEHFILLTKDHPAKKILTLRLMQDEVTQDILDSNASQNTLAREVSLFAKTNGFSGVMIDLEFKALPTQDTITSISDFTKTISSQLHKQDLMVSFAIYGDTYYRKRPYDVKAVGEAVDELFIMAYDFHKSFGTPGPGFPLSGQLDYGYDMQTMIADFTSFVPAKKITVIFGMYGREWIVDTKNRPLKASQVHTRAQIAKRFFPTCTFTDCVVKQDATSSETKISYTNADKTHVVWFEDEVSVQKKIQYLNQQGISSFSFWGYGYY